MYKVHLKLKDEEGNYILDNISDRGFLVKRDSVKKEELPMLIKEFCDIAEPDSSDKLLSMLSRFSIDSIGMGPGDDRY